MDTVSTRMTNTIVTNASINDHNKKVRYKMDCYILQTILLVILLLLLIIITTCYHYAKYRSKQKGIDELTI